MTRHLLCAVLWALCAILVPAWAGDVSVRGGMVDATHVLLVSAKPMALAGVQFALEPSVAQVQGRALSPGRDRLLLTLSQPLTQPATLQVLGLAGAPVVSLPLKPAAWPISREGLVFLWEDQQSLVPRNIASVAAAVPTRLKGNAALFDDQGRLKLHVGEIVDAPAGVSQCWRRRQFTLEFVYTPTMAPGDFPVVRLGDRFALRRQGTQVLWEMPGATLTCATITSPAPRHILVTADAGQVTCYIDGVQAANAPIPDGAFRGRALVLGAPAVAVEPEGTLDGVALYARAFTAEQARQAAAASLARRQAPVVETKQVVVQAELVACTEVPEPNTILPYRHALVTQEYLIREVVEGGKPGITVGVRIRVARWGILASKPTAVAQQKVGQPYRLVLESFKDHPDLERQFTVDDLPENYDLPYLLEVTRL